MDGIEKGLDLILDHFQEPIWPRTISTKMTECRQVLVRSREEALAKFKQANFLDCRISAYGPNADDNPSEVARFQGIRTSTPVHIIVLIDLDKCNFKSERALRLALNTILKNIKNKLNIKPTVLYSGRGYHIVLFLDTNGIVLEYIKEFEYIQQISLKFIRFIEWFLSNGKSDHLHNNSVSFGNMMLRIPGSINSKNGQMVTIVQKWNRYTPEIKILLRDFRHWLIDYILQEGKTSHRRQKRGDDFSGLNNNSGTIHWIETLLQTPLTDHRKFMIWRILAPYLLNKKQLSYEESYNILKEWLDRCNKLKRLDFIPNSKIKEGLKGAKKGYFPIALQDLKKECNPLYRIINGSL